MENKCNELKLADRSGVANVLVLRNRAVIAEDRPKNRFQPIEQILSRIDDMEDMFVAA